VFMVADRVEIFTRSALPNSEGLCSRSSGDGSFTISTAAGEAERGTLIVLHLKPDAEQFLDTAAVTSVAKKHSNFSTYPVLVQGERLNTMQVRSDNNDDELMMWVALRG